MPKLWGDNFFNPKTKKFTNDANTEEGTILKRAFA
jgi:elongation factor 2